MTELRWDGLKDFINYVEVWLYLEQGHATKLLRCDLGICNEETRDRRLET